MRIKTSARDAVAGELHRRMHDAVMARVPAFTTSTNPAILPALDHHLASLAENFVNRFIDGETGYEFVHQFAQQMAEQHFPLEALLHAYRSCLPVLLKVESELSGHDAISRSVDSFSFIDEVSSLAAEQHIDRASLMADVASDQRRELMSMLLHGYDESDRRVSGVLKDAGYLNQRLSFCVVLAQSIDPTEMHNPARARRLADSIGKQLDGIPGNRLIGIHRNKVTLIFSHQHRLSGWTAPREPLVTKIAEKLEKLGPSIRIGIGNEAVSTSQVPAAYEQALMAFDQSSIGHRVVRFSDVPLPRLLLHFAGDALSRVMPDWAAKFNEADSGSRGKLSATLAAYADADMNLLKTADVLGIHPNTLYARFDKIHSACGRDARQFHDLNALLIVIHSRDSHTQN